MREKEMEVLTSTYSTYTHPDMDSIINMNTGRWHGCASFT